MCDKGPFVEIPILIGKIETNEATITSQPGLSNVVPSVTPSDPIIPGSPNRFQNPSAPLDDLREYFLLFQLSVVSNTYFNILQLHHLRKLSKFHQKQLRKQSPSQ